MLIDLASGGHAHVLSNSRNTVIHNSVFNAVGGNMYQGHVDPIDG